MLPKSAFFNLDFYSTKDFIVQAFCFSFLSAFKLQFDYFS